MLRAWRWLVLLSLLVTAFLPGGLPSASTPWQSKVDASVWQAAQTGPAEFILYLQQQADLSAAANLPTKAEKGRYVFEQLTQTAQSSQKPLLTALETLARQGGVLEYRSYWIANMVWVRADGPSLARLAQRPDVAQVLANPSVPLDVLPEPPAVEVLRSLPAAPNAPQWNLVKVGADQVWALGYTGQGVVIGGQDTGYQWDHPALKAHYRGWNGVTADHNYNWHDAIHSTASVCPPNSSAPCDDNGHGTHTMGTMVGDDGLGTQIGMAPGARWIGCRNMGQGIGTPTTYAECYQWFIAPTDLGGQNPRTDLAPDIINNSWSCPAAEGCTDAEVLHSVVQAVRAAGIMTVHSAGNKGHACGMINDPAAHYAESFTVGSTDSNDTSSSFSSWGPITVDGSLRIKPDISAPGSGIYSSIAGSNYGTKGGTSMAAPHVAGLAALVLSAQPALSGDVDALESLIEGSALPLTEAVYCNGHYGTARPNFVFGWGRIDALAAVQAARGIHLLALDKRSSIDLYAPGQVFSYTLSLSDVNAPIAPTSVRITDTLPLNTSFISASLPYTLTGSTIVWPVAALAANQTISVTLTVQATGDAPITNADYAAGGPSAPRVTGPPVVVMPTQWLYLPLLSK